MLIPGGMFHPGGRGSGGGGLAGAASGGPRPFSRPRASPSMAAGPGGGAMRPPPNRQPQGSSQARMVSAFSCSPLLGVHAGKNEKEQTKETKTKICVVITLCEHTALDLAKTM